MVVTVSGAARTLFADAAIEVGLEFPPPSPAIALALRPQLPEFAHVSNPLDFNAAYTGLTGLTLENEPALRAWIQATHETGTPAALVPMMPENMSTQAQDICRTHGLACLQGLDDALAAIAAVAAHGERQAARGSADLDPHRKGRRSDIGEPTDCRARILAQRRGPIATRSHSACFTARPCHRWRARCHHHASAHPDRDDPLPMRIW